MYIKYFNDKEKRKNVCINEKYHFMMFQILFKSRNHFEFQREKIATIYLKPKSFLLAIGAMILLQEILRLTKELYLLGSQLLVSIAFSTSQDRISAGPLHSELKSEGDLLSHQEKEPQREPHQNQPHQLDFEIRNG